MRLKINHRGIRLYYRKRKCIKVHNILLLLLIIFGSVWTVKAFIKISNSTEHYLETAYIGSSDVELDNDTFLESEATELEVIEPSIEEAVIEPEEPKYEGVCAQYYDMVDQYDWDTEIMLAIMYAESSCRPNLDNTGLNKNGSVDYGLFQINSIHGHNPEDLMDPEYNIKAAYKIYKSQGLRAWSVYNSGRYLKYLSK